MAHISRSALYYFTKLPEEELSLKDIENRTGLSRSTLNFYIADWESAGLIDITYYGKKKMYKVKRRCSGFEEIEEQLRKMGFNVTGASSDKLKGNKT